MATERKGTQRAVLLVEEGGPMWANIRKALLKDGFALRSANGRQDGLKELGKQEFEIIITGLKLQDSEGLQVLRELKQAAPFSEVIVLTDTPSQESKWEALKLGAYDYLSTPLEEYQIRDVTRKALMHRNLRVNFREGGMAAGEGIGTMTLPPPDDVASHRAPANVAPASPSFSMEKEEEKFTFWWKEDEESATLPPRVTMPPPPPPPVAEPIEAPPPPPPPPPRIEISRVPEPQPEPPPLPTQDFLDLEPPATPTAEPPRIAVPTPPSVHVERERIEMRQEMEDLRLELNRLRLQNRELESSMKIRDSLQSEVDVLKSKLKESEMRTARPTAPSQVSERGKTGQTRVSLRVFAYTFALLIISLIGVAYFGLMSAQQEKFTKLTGRQVEQLQQQILSLQSSFDRLLAQPPAPTGTATSGIAETAQTPPPPESSIPAPTPKPVEPSWSTLATASPLGLPGGMVITTGKARLRRGPGIEFEQVAEVEPGTLLKVLKEQGEWLNVLTETGTGGYVWTPNTSSKIIHAFPLPGEKTKRTAHGEFIYPALTVGLKVLSVSVSPEVHLRAGFFKGAELWETVEVTLPSQPLIPFLVHKMELFCPRGIRRSDVGEEFTVRLLAAAPKEDYELIQEFPLSLK